MEIKIWDLGLLFCNMLNRWKINLLGLFREICFGGEITCLFFFFFPSIVMEILRILVLIGQILFSLAAVFLLCLVIKTYLIGPYYRKLHMESKGNKEILILGISAFIFLMLTVILKIYYLYNLIYNPFTKSLWPVLYLHFNNS